MQNNRFQKRPGKVFNKVWDDIKNNGKCIAIIAICLFIVNYVFGTICPVAICFGVPCPGCGMTRAAAAIVCGQAGLAIEYNAAVYLWAAYAVYWAVDRYIFENKKKNISMTVIIVVCLITLVYYVYRIYSGTLVPVESKGIIKWIISNIFA